VRGEVRERLERGQASGCTPGAVAELRDDTTPSALPDEAGSQQPGARAKPKASGTLVQENRLFQSALRAEQSGDHEQARALATKLLTRYPSSVMAPDARRILARVRESSPPRTP